MPFEETEQALGQRLLAPPSASTLLNSHKSCRNRHLEFVEKARSARSHPDDCPQLIHCRFPHPGLVFLTMRGDVGESDDKAQMENLVVDLTRELDEREGPVKIRDEEMRVYRSFFKPGIRQYVPVLTPQDRSGRAIEKRRDLALLRPFTYRVGSAAAGAREPRERSGEGG
jgi:hypothetical protein